MGWSITNFLPFAYDPKADSVRSEMSELLKQILAEPEADGAKLRLAELLALVVTYPHLTPPEPFRTDVFRLISKLGPDYAGSRFLEGHHLVHAVTIARAEEQFQ